jgi:hypothetical protein
MRTKGVVDKVTEAVSALERQLETRTTRPVVEDIVAAASAHMQV